MHQIKEALLEKCFGYVEARKQKILTSIANIEESLFEEGKSTAGDKHHTGRAMLQIDRENVGKQLLEVEKIERVVHAINLDSKSDLAKLGSLVTTVTATYFLSISAGAITVNGDTYFCISTLAPVGKLLQGKAVGDSFYFNGSEIQITNIA